MNDDRSSLPTNRTTRPDGRATYAVIDLDALAENLTAVRSKLSPGTEVMAVVKANGYGHGASMVAKTALGAGATRLAVATVGEGLRLRADGIAAPILVLSPIDPREVPAALRHELELTVATDSLLEAVAATARTQPAPAAVHVKVDTGMHRYGAEPEAAVALARRVSSEPALRLAGFSTHFAAADDADEHFTLEQAGRFDRCLAELAAAGIRAERVHAANSAAALRSRRYDYDMIRLGIALYGLPPSSDYRLPSALRPVMSLRSRIGRVVALATGDSVGYGRTYRCSVPERAALVPIGYADGYRRALSNRAWIGIGGQRAPILGRVSMDQMVVRIPPQVEAGVGDEVVIAGEDPAGAAPTMVELAELLDTIAYEVVSSIAARVPRQFVRGGELLVIDDAIAGPSS